MVTWRPDPTARDDTRLLDELLERFVRAWNGPQPPDLAQFLRDSTALTSAVSRQAAFAELVTIDLEHRWQSWREGTDRLTPPAAGALPAFPVLDDYLRLYDKTQLPREGVLRLVGEEYRVRRRWGDSPPREEFLVRYGKWGDELTALLERVELDNPTRPPDNDGHAAGGAPPPAPPPAARPPEKADPMAGSQLFLREGSLVAGDYEVVRRIGRGGMGVVYLARHRQMDRRVAVKLLPPSISRDPAMVKRFEREVKTAAQLVHPHIVMAYDARQDVHGFCFVMEYIDGRDMETIVESDGPLKVPLAVEYVRQAALGLAYAHGKGVVHRDIKPRNILIERTTASVKILDLGLATLRQDAGAQEELGRPLEAADRLTKTGAMMGTVDYMAPEQALDSKRADERSDLYSLGCVLFFLLTGSPIYVGDTLMKRLLAHRQDPLPKLRDIRSEVPPELESIFRRLAAKQPHNRYPSAAALIRDLDELPARARRTTGAAPQRAGDTEIDPPADAVPPPDSPARTPAGTAQEYEQREHAARFRRGLFFGTIAVCGIIVVARLLLWLIRGW